MDESLDINMTIHLGTYKHYKGEMYEVIGNAKHSETLEDMVVYRSLENDRVWVRPSAMFIEPMAKDGNSISRFTLVK